MYFDFNKSVVLLLHTFIALFVHLSDTLFKTPITWTTCSQDPLLLTGGGLEGGRGKEGEVKEEKYGQRERRRKKAERENEEVEVEGGRKEKREE